MEPTPTMGTPEPLHTPIPDISDPDIVENKDIAALGYVWLLSVFVFLYKRDSAFVRHHARQGIVLCIASILFWSIPIVGRFLELPVLALMIMGFLNAAQGRYNPLPLVYALSHGDMRMLRQSWKVIVDAVVRMWRKLRSKHPTSPINITVQAAAQPSPTPSSSDSSSIPSTPSVPSTPSATSTPSSSPQL